MANSILIWGIGKEFWELYNYFMLNEEIGNYYISGFISKKKEKEYIASKRVFFPEEIVANGIEFDYIIVASNIFLKEIIDYGCNKLHIERQKFINGMVMKLPYFEWNKYIKIYNDNVSLITETCLGGVFLIFWGCLFALHL